jgi:copper chaperone CopZ
MVLTYKLSGMTCSSCEATVKADLEKIEHVQHVAVSLADNTVQITMNKHISLAKLQQTLHSKYHISDIEYAMAGSQNKSWLQTYLPVLLIFAYILIVSLMIQLQQPRFNTMQWMRHFMAGFFLVFSFFKFLDLKGFAQSYQMYDLIAKNISIWAYTYVFIELVLGLSYLLNFVPFFTNLITFIVMSLSIVGVLQSVLNKRKIKCACLGAIFNLPMSTLTIIEDALMIAMSLGMLLLN